MSYENHLANIFNSLKANGLYPQYADFAEYQKAKYGIDRPEKKQLEIGKKTDYELWLEEMPEKERANYNYVFGEEPTKEPILSTLPENTGI